MRDAGSEREIRAGHVQEVRGRRPGVKQNFVLSLRAPPRGDVAMQTFDTEFTENRTERTERSFVTTMTLSVLCD